MVIAGSGAASRGSDAPPPTCGATLRAEGTPAARAPEAGPAGSGRRRAPARLLVSTKSGADGVVMTCSIAGIALVVIAVNPSPQTVAAPVARIGDLLLDVDEIGRRRRA